MFSYLGLKPTIMNIIEELCLQGMLPDATPGKDSLTEADLRVLYEKMRSYDAWCILDKNDSEVLNKNIIDFLMGFGGLFTSRSSARRLISTKAVRINGITADPDTRITPDSFLHNRYIIISIGKKKNFIIYNKT